MLYSSAKSPQKPATVPVEQSKPLPEADKGIY